MVLYLQLQHVYLLEAIDSEQMNHMNTILPATYSTCVDLMDWEPSCLNDST